MAPGPYKPVDLLSTKPRARPTNSSNGIPPWSPCAADTQTDRARLRFFVPDHQNVRQLLQGEIANLRAHLFVAMIDFHPQTGVLQRRLYLFRVFQMPFADGHNPHLHRRQPERESAGIVLHQHPKEPLD